MKNLSRTLSNTSQRTELVKNFKEIVNDVMAMRHRISRVEGVTGPGLFLMHRITSKGPQKLTDCSISLGVSKPTITKIVDNLEKDGFVKRTKGGKDRRTYYVHLTKFGKKRLDAMSKVIEDILTNATEHLSPEEIRILNSSISSIREKLRHISN